MHQSLATNTGRLSHSPFSVTTYLLLSKVTVSLHLANPWLCPVSYPTDHLSFPGNSCFWLSADTLACFPPSSLMPRPPRAPLHCPKDTPHSHSQTWAPQLSPDLQPQSLRESHSWALASPFSHTSHPTIARLGHRPHRCTVKLRPKSDPSSHAHSHHQPNPQWPAWLYTKGWGFPFTAAPPAPRSTCFDRLTFQPCFQSPPSSWAAAAPVLGRRTLGLGYPHVGMPDGGAPKVLPHRPAPPPTPQPPKSPNAPSPANVGRPGTQREKKLGSACALCPRLGTAAAKRASGRQHCSARIPPERELGMLPRTQPGRRRTCTTRQLRRQRPRHRDSREGPPGRAERLSFPGCSGPYRGPDAAGLRRGGGLSLVLFIINICFFDFFSVWKMVRCWGLVFGWSQVGRELLPTLSLSLKPEHTNQDRIFHMLGLSLKCHFSRDGQFGSQCSSPSLSAGSEILTQVCEGNRFRASRIRWPISDFL